MSGLDVVTGLDADQFEWPPGYLRLCVGMQMLLPPSRPSTKGQWRVARWSHQLWRSKFPSRRRRLADCEARRADYKAWGPYVSERAWGTVREDYSADGNAWDFFPHDHARMRAYRWSEDGIAGVSNRFQNVCLSLAFWNGRDAILKERLFGLTNSQGAWVGRHAARLLWHHATAL